MDVARLIHDFGYLAVALGTFLEGETVLVLAGAAAGAAVGLPARVDPRRPRIL